MNKNEHILDLVSWVCLLIGVSLADFKDIIYIIIGLISLITTLVSSVISIVVKIKNASKDGVITDEELKDIQNEFDKLGDKINERKDNRN